MSTVHNIPFITQGIEYRDDLISTGSYSLGNALSGSIITYSTDGDILTINASGSSNGYVSLIINSSQIIGASLLAFRAKTGSNMDINGKCDVVLYSGSTSQLFSINNNSNFQVLTGSISSISNILAEYLSSNYSFLDYQTVDITSANSGFIDKIELRIEGLSDNCSGQFDFIQLYDQNIPFNYIDKGDIELKKRAVELHSPNREQGIIQILGSQSPVIGLEGRILTDKSFTAQQYLNNIFLLYNEKTYQWFNSDFVQTKIMPEDLETIELAGISNYYKIGLKFREYSVITATSGSAVYNI